MAFPARTVIVAICASVLGGFVGIAGLLIGDPRVTTIGVIVSLVTGTVTGAGLLIGLIIQIARDS